jgi:predicted RNase H-like nuclease (RuvC/YqgF family)
MTSTYGKTWDGKSRPVDETYRQNYDDIFGSKKEPEKVKEQHTDPEQDLLLMEEQIAEIKRLQKQIGSLQVQIADYQQIVKELTARLEQSKIS